MRQINSKATPDRAGQSEESRVSHNRSTTRNDCSQEKSSLLSPRCPPGLHSLASHPQSSLKPVDHSAIAPLSPVNMGYRLSSAHSVLPAQSSPDRRSSSMAIEAS